MKKELFKQIPAVNDILESKQGESLIEKYSHNLVLKAVRSVLDEKRNTIAKTPEPELENMHLNLKFASLFNEIEDYIEDYLAPNLENVINATGTIVHTNLGRSLLSKEAVDSLVNVAENYSTLEIDKQSGERGSRYNNVREFLIELSGAEDGLVVNNNAAAVLLILDTFAKNKEVILARGEMVEVGGSFRIPEVMEKSGAELIEVGATNKVYKKDYEDKINEETGMLLKVHTSNYKVMGFTKEVQLKELVELGKEYNLPVVEDLGSGILRDLSDLGLLDEPTVADKIAQGADLVSFSGDKLLGGPQAGIILGKKDYISKLKKNPLTRALRVDKFTLASLEATLKAYIKEEDREVLPTLKMISEDIEVIKNKAKRLRDKLYNINVDRINTDIRKDSSKTGGGAFPVQEIPTYVTRVQIKDMQLNDLSYKLRMNNPPIFTRLKDDYMLFDLRTIKDEEIEEIVTAFKKII
ncbi:MAG TPA: L-seryl-tRNA(Sec) selenium transferase [Halanaerobiales bacterium]|nr:L-seryl-tRNA(Sec) selenium transferase [Halanaerobiales bacterium]